MNLISSLIWMFIGSFIIGIYFNGMNMLAYRYSDIYFSSKTLIYIALLMASNMCILEIMMFYYHYGKVNNILVFMFILLSLSLIYMLRTQYMIGDRDWLKRMISHHSTALTTSYKIRERTNNSKIKELANNIIKSQEEEIILMKNLLL